MHNFFVLMSHRLTTEQLKDIEETLKCENIFYLPSELQKEWSQISPEQENREEGEENLKKFIRENSSVGDYILIQGEWGYTYDLVNYAKSLGLIPLYSASKRVAKEMMNEKGNIVKYSIFKHVKFKKY